MTHTGLAVRARSVVPGAQPTTTEGVRDISGMRVKPQSWTLLSRSMATTAKKGSLPGVVKRADEVGALLVIR
jgi:hypothetical protein